MFTNQEILERLSTANLEDLSKIEETIFEQLDFVVVGGEDTVIIHRGQRNEFSDFVDFYLKSFHRIVEYLNEEKFDKNRFEKEYLSNIIYQPIAENDFLNVARGYTKGLKDEFTFSLDGQWSEGVRIFNEHDEFHAVAATDSEYCSFFWMTTA